MSIIHVLNCGGLGNRLNNIINGIYLSEILDRELRVTWPLNDACYCPYNELFANPLKVKYIKGHEPVSIDDYNKIAGAEAVLYKRKWSGPISDIDTSGRFKEYGNIGLGKKLLKELSEYTGSILLQGPTILPFVPIGDVIRILASFQVVDNLSAKISEYMFSEKIDKSVIGAHIRQTDTVSKDKKICMEKIRKIISSNPRQRIFVCSDSQEVESELKLLYPANIITHDKTSYPERRDETREWDERDQGQSIYNVTRSKESVQQAVVDMYLLSNTNLMIRSQGTFSKIAYYLSLSDWAKSRRRFGIFDRLFLYRVRKYI